MTPGGSSSPFLSFSLRSSVILRSTSIWREVISSISSIFSMRRGSFSLSFRRLRLRVEIFSISSRVSSVHLVNRRLLVFSSCKSACKTLPPSRSERRLRRSSVRMRISSARFFSSLKTCVAYFVRSERLVARRDFVILDVNRSVVVVFHKLFTDEYGVFEVVSAPRQQGHKDVAPESQFAALGARAVGENLAFLRAVSDTNQRILGDASVLVRALEFDALIDVRAHFAAEHAGMVGLDAQYDA